VHIVDNVIVGVRVILDQLFIEALLMLVLDLERYHLLYDWIKQGVRVG
jgi:hypothetical protein